MTNTEHSAADTYELDQPNVLTTTRHSYSLRNGDQAELCIQSSDPQDPSTLLLRDIPDALRRQPWVLSINSTVFIETGRDGKQRQLAGKLSGILIKRELIPRVEDEFLRRMMSVNSFTQQQAQQLFDSQGRLRRKYRGRGVWGSDNDDSWIFEIGMMEIMPGYRRAGIGKRLVDSVREEVLTWAGEEQREVLIVLMLGAPKSEVDEHKFNQPASSAADLQRVSTVARLRAKRFWRSLGFRRLSGRSNWFGWARSLAACELKEHPFTTQREWDTEDEESKINTHDDDMAVDVAEKYELYKHSFDPLAAKMTSGFGYRPGVLPMNSVA